MKKSVFCIFAGVLMIAPLSVQHSAAVDQSSQAIISSEEPEEKNDFQDFFGVDEDPAAPPIPKKEKLSPVQILLMKMGVSVMMGMERVYGWAMAVWLYAQSLVKYERKA